MLEERGPLLRADSEGESGAKLNKSIRGSVTLRLLTIRMYFAHTCGFPRNDSRAALSP